MAEFTVRSAELKDMESLAAVYAEAFNSLGVNESWSTDAAKSFLLHCYRKQPDLFFVIEEGGQIIGGVSAEIKPWYDGNHLTNFELFVSPAAQRRGAARHLLAPLVSAAAKYKVVALEAVTFADKAFPLSWYKRLAFREVHDLVLLTADPADVLAVMDEDK